MDRQQIYIARTNSKNGRQCQYAFERLCGIADKLMVDSNGKIIIEIPVLNGAMGLVNVTVTDRQPRDQD